MTQMDLTSRFGTPAHTAPEQPLRKGRPSIEERFATFHAANPHVIEELRCYLATTGSEAGGERYRLDNSLVSRYADLLAETDPRIAAAIERRKRRA
jgi:hypothetical protein